VILNAILATLALLSLALTLWQWLVARRFPLHERVADKSYAPAVTLLKPLKGSDETTADSLRSWFAQDYSGEVQMLFGVALEDDPVCGVVRQLMLEHPERLAELVVCGKPSGANAKVSKLVQLESLAKHGILIISDADVRVPADLLANVVVSLGCDRQHASCYDDAKEPQGLGVRQSSGAIGITAGPVKAPDDRRSPKRSRENRPVGLVNCFYRLANPTTPAMRWEAVAINADFWSQVLQSRSLKPLDFALGAVMAVKREALQKIGGFAALTDHLADDYQLGNRVARAGWRIELSPVVVECWSVPMGWREVWRHQLRWARTVRVCQPLPYFFSILSNATLWPLVWLLVNPTKPVLAGAVVCWLVRLLIAINLEQWLTQSCVPIARIWLVPVKDLLQTAIWLLAFAGRRIEWRGERYRLRRDGRLEKKG
jgi:ceramide glucosyltransferase